MAIYTIHFRQGAVDIRKKDNSFVGELVLDKTKRVSHITCAVLFGGIHADRARRLINEAIVKTYSLGTGIVGKDATFCV